MEKTKGSTNEEGGRKVIVLRKRKRKHEEEDGSYLLASTSHRKLASRRGKRVVREQETSSDTNTSTADYTSDGQERKVMKPTNCYGHVRVNKNATYYRSNLKTSIKELKALYFKDTHLREIERTPFWLMFDAIYRMGDAQLKKRCQKNEDVIRQIMLAFDHLSESFMIAGQQIHLSNRDVQLIFGISGGPKTIPLKLREYELPPWIHRCFGQEISASNGPYVLYKNYIFEKLKQMLSRDDITSVTDVARLTHCYLMAAVLSPNQNASIPWHLTTYLEKFDEIGRYDWCKFIVEMLRSQFISSKNLRAGGCAILLPFWLCEHTHLIQPKNELAFPRFLKWDLNDLNKKLSRVKLSKLDRECVSKLVLKPTTMEKEKFRTLFTYCDFEVERQRNHPFSDDEEVGGELSIFGDEDVAELIAELGNRGGLNIIRKDLLSKKDIHEDIPSTSKKKFGQNIQSNTKRLETDDMSSFSLNLSQMTTPPPNVNDVIEHVTDDLIASGGDFATGTQFTDDVEIEAGLDKSNEEGGRKMMVLRKRKHGKEDGSYLLASTSHRKLASRRGKRVVKEQETSSDTDTSTADYTSDGQERKVMKPTNCYGHVRVNKNATYYRSNLKTSIKALKALYFKDTHLREIERTPFWLMFDAIYRMGDAQLKKRCQKNEDVIRQIMLAFDHLSESFMIAGQQIHLSNRDVQLIFGISGGSKTIPLKLREYEIPPWIHRCFGQEISASNGPYVLYKNHIFEKLKQMLSRDDNTSVMDVARLTHCYLMAAVLSPNQNASIPWHLTTYVEKFDEIGRYDWCKFIVEMLRSQIISSKNLRAGGCAILLPFWLCEHTHLIRPKNELAFPRFLKWDLNDLNKKLSRVKLSKLDRECVSKLVLKPTTMEKEKFRTLITYCDFEVERQRNHPFSDDEEIGEELSFFGDEDVAELIAELGNRGGLNTIRKDLFSKKDIQQDIPSPSKKEFGQNIQSNTKRLETDDMSSFSLNLSQMTTPPPNANDVIEHVIDDLIASGGDFATGTQVTDDVEIEAGLGKSNEVNSGVPEQVGVLEKESGGERSNLIKELVVMNKFGNSTSKLKAGVRSFISSVISDGERLSSEVEQLHRETELERASFEAELKKKEDCIAKLRAENDDLRTQLKKMSVSTPVIQKSV